MDDDTEPEDIPPMAPTHHESLWFPGGDIVLATNTYLFKVHKDLLALQSSVFKDMFELEQAVEDGQGIGQLGETYEDLPLVALAGDEGEDLAHLLKAVYYREFYDRDNDETPLEVIIALLVLSNKYDFKHIQSEVTKQLSRLYPRSFDAFEDVDDNAYDLNLFGTDRMWCEYRLLKAYHTANITILLPLLYYSCVFSDIDQIYVEVDRAGGLDRDCLRTLLSGKFKLEHAYRGLVASLPDEFRKLSCSSCKADAYVSRLHQQTGSHLVAYKGGNMALSILKKECTLCFEKFEKRIEERRRELWDVIPTYFGFPGWDELQ